MSYKFPEYISDDDIKLLDDAIAYCEKQPVETWWAGPTYRSPDQTQHCVLSHIAVGLGMEAIERFESVWSTSYAIGSANDGNNPNYPQPTAKERSLAFLYNLRNGTEEDIITGMEKDYQRYLLSKEE